MAIMQRFKGKVAFNAVQVGGGAASITNPAGVISSQGTPAVSAATNTTQTLMSYSLPANTLNRVGAGLFVRAWGAVAGNAAPRNIILNVGGKTLATGSQTQSGVSWRLDAQVVKTGNNAQSLLLSGMIGTTTISPSVVTDTSVDTGAITISVTAVDASAAATNVTQNAMVVEAF